MKVEYSSNNSGGDWWLEDADWFALEKAGWDVKWFKDEPEGGFRPKEERWLGGLAKEATKEFPDISTAIKEFEKITGEDTSEEGCNCCGAPHSFRW